MSKLKSATLCLILFAILNLLATPLALGGLYSYKPHPRDIYHKAWELVRDTYYDPSFNGQNWQGWEHRFDGEILMVKDAHRDIKIMLESLKDPQTRFLDPQSFKDESDSLNVKRVGIGIELGGTRGHLVVSRTLENGPAKQAGMQSNDQIEFINGRDAATLTPEEAENEIRGTAGSLVQISFKRGTEHKSLNITRAEVTQYAVEYKVLKGNIGYIHLASLIGNDAARELRTALANLSETDGLIIDLRDNAGGLISNSLEIADMLLDGGVVVSTAGRNGRSVDTASGNPITKQSIAVLANGESFGATEVLIAALKDNHRAVIIGTHTSGQGLVTEINHLPGGAAIHISVSRWFTPAGTDISHKGVQPDIEVSDRAQQEQEAINYLKARRARGR